MKLYNYFLILCSLLLYNTSSSQVPGYLGKRFSIDLSAQVSPALFAPSQNNYGLNNLRNSSDNRLVGIALNHAYTANINYVIKRYSSLSLSLSQYYTGLVTELQILSLTGLEFETHRSFHRLQVRSAGIKYNIFSKKRGSLAPIGRYFSLGLFRSLATSTIEDRIILFSQAGTISPINYEQRIDFYAIELGVTKIKPITDKIYFKYGTTFKFPFTRKQINNFVETDNFSLTPSTNQDEYESSVYLRVLGHDIYSIEIGLGYLIF